MIIRIFKLIFLVYLLSLVGCGLSEEEQKVYEICYKSLNFLDAYEKGEHISKTTTGVRMGMDVCRVKSSLFVEGYRVSETINNNDIRLWSTSLMSDKSLERIYKKALKDGMDLRY